MYHLVVSTWISLDTISIIEVVWRKGNGFFALPSIWLSIDMTKVKGFLSNYFTILKLDRELPLEISKR